MMDNLLKKLEDEKEDEVEAGLWTHGMVIAFTGAVGLGMAISDGYYQRGWLSLLLHFMGYWIVLYMVAGVIGLIVGSTEWKKTRAVAIIVVLFGTFLLCSPQLDNPLRYDEESDSKQLKLVEWAFEYGYDTGYKGYGLSARDAYIEFIGDVEDPEEFWAIKSAQEKVAKEESEQEEIETEEETSEAEEEAVAQVQEEETQIDDYAPEPDTTEFTSQGTPINTGFKMDSIDMQDTARSACFSRVGYDASEGLLVVTFRESGADYLYYDVPEAVWDGLQAADTMGRYYQDHIKDEYFCEKLE